MRPLAVGHPGTTARRLLAVIGAFGAARGVDMSWLLRGRIAVAATSSIWLALTGPVQGKTCSERLQVCYGYCAKSMGDSARCHEKCRQLDQECMASGCWESKFVARQCGFTRQ